MIFIYRQREKENVRDQLQENFFFSFDANNYLSILKCNKTD